MKFVVMFPRLVLVCGLFMYIVSLYRQQSDYVGEWVGVRLCGFVVVLLVEVGRVLRVGVAERVRHEGDREDPLPLSLGSPSPIVRRGTFSRNVRPAQ